MCYTSVMDKNKNENNDTEEITVPKIEVIKCFWLRERTLWLGARAVRDPLAELDAYTNLNNYLDEALDLGLLTPAVLLEPAPLLHL